MIKANTLTLRSQLFQNRRRHTGICYLRLTNIQHGKCYVHDTTFYSLIFKNRLNSNSIKFKGK